MYCVNVDSDFIKLRFIIIVNNKKYVYIIHIVKSVIELYSQMNTK